MKTMMKRISLAVAALVLTIGFCYTLGFAPVITTYAAENNDQTQSEEAATEDTAEVVAMSEAKTISNKAIAAAGAIGLVAAAGAISMGLAIGKSSEAISRQPEASGEIRSSLMLGLVFIETAIIYALIVAILIVFVL